MRTITPEVGLAEVGRRGLGDEERALRGRAEAASQSLLGHGVDGLGHEALAGRVDDEVEPAQLGRRALDERPDGVRRRARSPSFRPAASTRKPSASSRAAIAPPTRPVPPVTSAEDCEERHGGTISSRATSREENVRTWPRSLSTTRRSPPASSSRSSSSWTASRAPPSRRTTSSTRATSPSGTRSSAKLAEVDLAAANQVYSEIRALKVDLTFAIGGVKNHEIYFEHLGGGGGDPDGAIGDLIAATSAAPTTGAPT